jgi:XTP/dITP diphosphohydrolase
MTLTFASSNKNKIKEIQALLGTSYAIKSLEDIGCFDDIPETQTTIEGNASQKSFYVYNKYKVNCFSDDTGLEIDALNGAPGVYSARYAGEQRNAVENMNLVLHKLHGISLRAARFKTVISLVIDGKEKQFTGILKGEILTGIRGDMGFGYDPIFKPEGHSRTLAEMSVAEKNVISHRGLALEKLIQYLRLLPS